MTTFQKQPGLAFWTTVLLVVVLVPAAIYLGAYAWLVEPTPVVTFPVGRPEHRFVVPTYPRLGKSQTWRTFFRTANELDRSVRPDVWQG